MLMYLSGKEEEDRERERGAKESEFLHSQKSCNGLGWAPAKLQRQE